MGARVSTESVSTNAAVSRDSVAATVRQILTSVRRTLVGMMQCVRTTSTRTRVNVNSDSAERFVRPMTTTVLQG